MSIRQITQVLHGLSERLTDGQFRILVYLADCADPYGDHIFPSVDWLSEKTGYKRRTIQLTLKYFQLRGWLEEVREPGGRLRYRLTLSGAGDQNSDHGRIAKGETGCENLVEIVRRSVSTSTSTDQNLISTIAFRDPTDQNSSASVDDERTSTSDPSLIRPRSVQTTGAGAPALTHDGENENDDEARGVASTDLRDRAPGDHGGADDRPGRVEGAHQGPGESRRLPDAGQRTGVERDGGGGACTPEAAAGEPATRTRGADGGAATRDGAGDPPRATNAAGGLHVGATDPRAGTPADPRLDVRGFLSQLKARLKAGRPAAAPTEAAAMTWNTVEQVDRRGAGGTDAAD